MKHLLLSVWLLACVGAGALLAWWSPPQSATARIPSASQLAPDPFFAPVKTQATEGLSDNLDAVRMWEGFRQQAASAPEQALTPPLWRIVGTTTNGTNSHVLVLFQGSNAPSAVPVGGQLPGGATVVSIHERDVGVRLNQRIVFLPYGQSQ